MNDGMALLYVASSIVGFALLVISLAYFMIRMSKPTIKEPKWEPIKPRPDIKPGELSASHETPEGSVLVHKTATDYPKWTLDKHLANNTALMSRLLQYRRVEQVDYIHSYWVVALNGSHEQPQQAPSSPTVVVVDKYRPALPPSDNT